MIDPTGILEEGDMDFLPDTDEPEQLPLPLEDEAEEDSAEEDTEDDDEEEEEIDDEDSLDEDTEDSEAS
jgi:hypothetical protein